ncbi:regulatory iron-sulfur-containing complex subunit RicT [Cloacibacillus sp. An23]|uniref:PSP1 domain-containing protein n=1 Tax=Cloacibacillus sp. An23 TaxID=1965591 RepID=UPI000B38053A|nr:regulatory iron-sulfur-containing complex subunit RicT [Cloacibacillus sp. An23]OUO94605.1 hypothetical protein B5F39_01655 [Cloacibacillus sp. An23]
MRKYLAVYGKPRYLGLVEYDGDIKKCAKLVVETARGEENALVVGELTPEQEREYRQLRHSSEHGDGMVKNSEPVVTDLAFVGFATDDDLEREDEYREEEKSILVEAKRLLKPHKLDMKLIDVEFLRAKRKLFFYFSSDQRVDFRAYVRDLAREFKTRIELRQVGVRDEAKIIRGVGPCGRPCCCSYWLNQFAPICIKMVKEQNLALNPSKISGICGRLMCCMCYEYGVYHEAWEGFPHPGSKIKTPNGSVVVAGIDLPTQSLRVMAAGKGELKIPKDRFEEFRETVTSGGEWVVPEAEPEEEPVFSIHEAFSMGGGCQRCRAGKEPDPKKEREQQENDGAKEQHDDRRRGKRRKKHAPRPERRQETDEADVPGAAPRFGSDPQQQERDKRAGDRPRRHSPRRRRPSGAKKGAE